MKKGGGKQKGGGFERLICKELSLWLSGGKREDLFWRSAMSGGRATITLNKEAVGNQAGDISPIDKLGQTFTDIFFLECKFYKDLKLSSLLFGTPKKDCILEFWGKAVEEAAKYNKHPLLICKQNHKEIIIFTDYNGYSCEELNLCEAPFLAAMYKPAGHYIYVYKFEDFKKVRFISRG